jgi:hypothetical protein
VIILVVDVGTDTEEDGRAVDVPVACNTAYSMRVSACNTAYSMRVSRRGRGLHTYTHAYTRMFVHLPVPCTRMYIHSIQAADSIGLYEHTYRGTAYDTHQHTS